MKVRFCLVLLVVCGVIFLCGCQRSEAKADAAEVTAGQGEAEKVVQVAETNISDTVKVKTRTVRIRDPKTGQTVTKEVPISTTTARCRASDTPQTRTVRTRDPKTGRTVTRQVPVDPEARPDGPAENKFEVRWPENCSVQQAFNATHRLLYDTFGLKKVYASSQRSYYEPASDAISATLKARSVIGITFDVNIVLISPDSCMMVIKAFSETQPEDIIRKHVLYLQAKIGEAIAQEAGQTDEAAYPTEIILNHATDEVYQLINRWAEKWQLHKKEAHGDRFYRLLRYSCMSGIDFEFVMRLIDTNKTKLEIDIRNYEGKEEFGVILKSFETALAELEKPAEAVEEGVM